MMKYAKEAPQRRSSRQIYEDDNPSERRNQMGMLLWQKATQQSQKRVAIENQWIEARNLYQGKADNIARGHGGLSDARNTGSTVSVNVIRTKTDVMSAWLQNLTFPAGDKPWQIRHTPVPELVFAAKHGTRGMVSPQVRVPEQKVNITPEQAQAGEEAVSLIQQAKRSAEQMEKIISDRLVECDYEREMRAMIDQACQLGTGVIKGPVGPDSDYRRAMEPRWFFDPETGEPYESTLSEQGGEQKPSAVFVSLWNVFPDMRARDFRDCEFVFERHTLTRNQLLKLANVPGYDRKAIIRASRYDGASEKHAESRQRENRFFEDNDDREDQYVMWEYHGPLLFDDYCTICQHLMANMDEDDESNAVKEGMQDDREIEREMGLSHTNVTIRLVDGEIISMARSDFAAGDIYHAFTPIPTQNVFGRSLPQVLGKLQKILNALYRDIVNGSRISSTAHVTILEGVERVDGSKDWDAVQIWRVPTSVQGTPGAPALQTHAMPSQIKDSLEAFHMTRQMIDDISGIPLISQGEQAGHITKTASGLGLLNDNAQTTARRMVRMLDDQTIKRLITSFYRWEMLYGQDKSAKGDYSVEARGSSVLYSRQVQGELLPVFWQTYKDDADARAALKTREIMKQHASVLGMPPDTVLKNEDEIQRDEEALAQQPDPEMEAVAEEIAIKKQKVQSDFEAKMKKIEEEAKQAQEELDFKYYQVRAEHRARAAEMGRAARQEQQESKTNKDM